ncbi:MAG TPA: hypothetical protein VER98_11500, partial [Terriglobia bacterium]|nr:hypothetical protein [Terriglobia bacterium]
GLIRDPDGFNWPAFEFTFGKFDWQPLLTDELVIAANVLGVSRIEDVLNAVFETPIFGGSPPSHSVHFNLPIYAHVADVAIEQQNLRVDIEHHPNIAAVPKAHVMRNERSTFIATEPIPLQATAKDTSEGTDIFVRTRYIGRRPTEVKNQLQITIADASVGSIDNWSHFVEQILPIEEVSSLYLAVRRFVGDERLTECLLRCQERPTQRTKPSAAYELYVSWLLSMIGLSPVVLGEYEKLAAVKTDFVWGSVDIVAEGPETHTIFLVGCSLVVPPSNDYATLLTAKSVLHDEVFKDGIRIQPVIFTGARGVAPRAEVGTTAEVIVIDADRVETILKYLSRGQRTAIRDYFERPWWSSVFQ